MADTPDVTDHLALALVPGLGPKLTAALLERFGSATAARRATAAELQTIPHIGAKLAGDLAAALRNVDIGPEVRLMEAHGVRAIPLGFPNYPAPLAAVPGPPPILYVRGEWTAADANAVGIVGSRNCTPSGLKVAGAIARGLVRAGFTVISGLARGIDGAAHRAALEAGGRTVAVLAGGLSRIYPPEHAGLADEIAAGRGCLYTEAAMPVSPQPGMFPQRNRLISGLSRAVVVVEANIRSGALSTARHAAEQGREVFAVPGPVDRPESAGCLELLRSGARLVRSADDVIEDLRGIAASGQETRNRRQSEEGDRKTGIQKTGDRRQETGDGKQVIGPAPSRAAGRPEPPPPAPLPELSPTERVVFAALSTSRHADELTRETGLPVGELSIALMRLDLKRLVRRLPGNYYERR